ncbi:MAG TPA: GNAT family N-acetyltransferase [Candidatus Saccharimonadales bacterium]|nr:GNAT family N-acetyltransferase [Candidatus Saccharimonadales bacterium]
MEITLAAYDDVAGILPLLPQIYRVSELPPEAKQTLEQQIDSDNCDVVVAKENGKVLGAGTIFYLKNAGHTSPFAFLEGIVVDDAARGKGIGTALSKKAIELAKAKGCYKMIFTSGMDREKIHKFYEELGFKKWGFEFRMDL